MPSCPAHAPENVDRAMSPKGKPMPIAFKNPTKGARCPHLLATLDHLTIADTPQLGWQLFPESLGRDKPVLQGMQAFLKKHVDEGLISRVPVAGFLGFEGLHRYAYYLPNRRIPGREAGHRLITNAARVPIILMAGYKDAPVDDIYHIADYDVQRVGERLIPATRQELTNSTEFDPDLLVRIRLLTGETIIWIVEADNGTEPIVAGRKGGFEGDLSDDLAYHRTCIVHKVGRFLEYVEDEGAWEGYADNGEVVAIQNPWVLNSEARLDRVHEKLVAHLGPIPSVWLTTRSAIEDPRDFWTKPVWRRCVPDAQPFALLEGRKLAMDRIDGGISLDINPDKARRTVKLDIGLSS